MYVYIYIYIDIDVRNPWSWCLSPVLLFAFIIRLSRGQLSF